MSIASANPYWKRNGGIAVLQGDQREASENLIEDLARYGLFIVDRGDPTGGAVEFGVADDSRYYMEMPNSLWQAMANLLFN